MTGWKSVVFIHFSGQFRVSNQSDDDMRSCFWTLAETLYLTLHQPKGNRVALGLGGQFNGVSIMSSWLSAKYFKMWIKIGQYKTQAVTPAKLNHST